MPLRVLKHQNKGAFVSVHFNFSTEDAPCHVKPLRWSQWGIVDGKQYTFRQASTDDKVLEQGEANQSLWGLCSTSVQLDRLTGPRLEAHTHTNQSRCFILRHFPIIRSYLLVLFQFSSVHFSRLIISNSLRPLDCSTPGSPVHHQLLELAQIHVH